MAKPFWPSGRRKGWSSSGTALLSGGAEVRRKRTQENTDWLPEMQLIDLSLPPRLGELERGALIMPNVRISDGGSTVSISEGGFDPDTVRGALLLFDHLSHPANNFMKMADLVEECSALPNVHDGLARFSGGQLGVAFLQALAESFAALDKREPGRWSLARNAQQFDFPSTLLGDATAFRIKLENALPLPDRSLPYEEVQGYKNRRRAELLALRSHLDELALEAAHNGLGGLAETHAYERFLIALEDHNRAIREQNFAKRLFDLDVKFNWDRLLYSIPTAGAAWTQGFTSAALIAAGVAASSISIESSVGLKKTDREPRPFEYIFRARNEL